MYMIYTYIQQMNTNHLMFSQWYYYVSTRWWWRWYCQVSYRHHSIRMFFKCDCHLCACIDIIIKKCYRIKKKIQNRWKLLPKNNHVQLTVLMFVYRSAHPIYQRWSRLIIIYVRVLIIICVNNNSQIHNWFCDENMMMITISLLIISLVEKSSFQFITIIINSIR